MSLLTFREQAAIALRAPRPIAVCDLDAVASEAQKLADACCKAWGHDERPFFLSSPGIGTIAAGGITQDHKRCIRCGLEIK